MRKFGVIGAIAGLALSGPASAEKLGKAEQEAISKSPEQVAALVQVDNDVLDTAVKLSTMPFYQMKQGLLKVVNNDKFVRAWIDKKSGETRYQVYVFVTYGGSGWAFFNRATYEAPSGPEEVAVDQIATNVGGCSTIGCSHREDFGFDVPEGVLRWAARDAKAGDASSWKFRLYPKAGQPSTTELLKTELAGLLIRVDQERAKMGFGPVSSEK